MNIKPVLQRLLLAFAVILIGPQARSATGQIARSSDVSTNRWPSFRGLGARGLASTQRLPRSWDVASMKSIRWKTPIPGLSNSSPIIWDDRVFVVTAVSGIGDNSLKIGLYGAGEAVADASEHSWRLYCLDRSSGEILWQRTAEKGIPEIKRHLKSTQANSTPATDGRHVVALFNSGGLVCYTSDGRLVWKKNLGVLDSGAFDYPEYQWGFGSSPVIASGAVIVQCDIQTGSFLAAFALSTGEPMWRIARDELPSWGTPTVYQSGSDLVVATNGSNFIRGYRLSDGKEIWRLAGNSKITVPTPFVANSRLYVTSGYRPIQPIYAIRVTAKGNITLDAGQTSNEHVAWSVRRGGPYLPTPIVVGPYLYTCSNSGILVCYRAETGEVVYRRRVGNGASFTASPVAADGVIYLTAEAGTIFSVNAGPDFAMVSRNQMNEYCLATPAIAGGMMFVRTQKSLIAVGDAN